MKYRSQLLRDRGAIAHGPDLSESVLARRRELDLDAAVGSPPRRIEELAPLPGRPAEARRIQRRPILQLPTRA